MWKNSINFSVHSWKRVTAKPRTEKSPCNILSAEVKILHLPKAQFTPRNEASPLLLAEKKNTACFCFLCHWKEKKKGKNRLFHFGTEILWETTENSELALTYSENWQRKRWHFEGSHRVLHASPEPFRQMYYPLFLFKSSTLLCDMTSHLSGSCKFKAIPRKDQRTYIGYRQFIHIPR